MPFYSSLAITFGEIDLSPLTVAGLAALSLFTFACVGISSMALFKPENNDD